MFDYELKQLYRVGGLMLVTCLVVAAGAVALVWAMVRLTRFVTGG